MDQISGNEWRSVDMAKWRNSVSKILSLATNQYLEAWEIEGQIAYILEKVAQGEIEV